MWQPPACYEGCRTPNLTPPAETSSTAPHGLQLAPVTPHGAGVSLSWGGAERQV